MFNDECRIRLVNMGRENYVQSRSAQESVLQGEIFRKLIFYKSVYENKLVVR